MYVYKNEIIHPKMHRISIHFKKAFPNIHIVDICNFLLCSFMPCIQIAIQAFAFAAAVIFNLDWAVYQHTSQY